MISVNHLTKIFNEQKVLDDVSIILPNKGLYFILGPSGCGKSTLLNCISGLMDYSGEILINGDNIASMSDDELSDYRLKNIGFVFQDFKLFGQDNVYENVALPYKCIAKVEKKYKKRRVEDLLELVGIKHLINEKVSNLSGGEKQRVGIARSIINDPKILLCDEPTGALDSLNKIEIMTILKTISTTRLVLVVSHDEELTKKYADGIYYLKDGRVIKRNIIVKPNKETFLPIFNNHVDIKKTKLPQDFLLRHTNNSIKNRKFRSIVTNLMLSFGLLGSGLAFMVSDTIYQSVMSMYSNIIDDNQVIVTLNDKSKTSNEIVASNDKRIAEIQELYPDEFNGEGVGYYGDFENNFKHRNFLCVANGMYRYILPKYSARYINDFVWLEDCTSTIYPFNIKELKNDEIIIAIDATILRNICHEFRIAKTVESLSNFIEKNPIYLSFDFANRDWQYEDEQILTLKGFILDSNPTIFHSNHKWNEWMIEYNMRMPVNYNFSMKDDKPWVLKKYNYLSLNKSSDHFLTECYKNDDLKNNVFELANEQFFRTLKDNGYNKNNRLIVFENNFMNLYTSDWKHIKRLQKSVKNPIFSTNSGYSVYGTSLLSGFNNVMFFANSEDLLLETTGTFASNGYDPTASIKLPKGVLQGHYTKTSNNGVFFKGLEGNDIKGNQPKNIREIVVSTGLANQLFGTERAIGNVIEIASTSYAYQGAEQRFDLSFKTTKLTISGIIKNDKNILYQNDYWSLLFFQCLLGVSSFELLPMGMSMEIDKDVTTSEVIKTLEKEFPQYHFSNPLKDIENQANEMCFYIKIILFILSIATLIIAICLITICNLLHILEIKQDFGLIRCIGLSNKQSKKMLFSHSFLIAILGASTSIFEMVLLFFLSKYGLNWLFGIEINLVFNVVPYILVVVLSLLIGVIPALIVSKKLESLDPLESLKI